MANPTIRAFPVYYKGKKIAEAYENEYGIKTGRTAMFGAEGYYAHSKGAVQTTLQISYVVPVRGVSVSLVEDCLAQNDVDIGAPYAGKIDIVSMAITENKLKANTEKGTLEGTLSLEGGMPNRQGF